MSRRVRSDAGFSVSELMLSLGIVAVLAAAATPRLSQYVASSRRAEATLGLALISRMQEQHYEAHGRYTDSLVELGYAMDQGAQTATNTWKGKYYRFVVSLPEGDDQTFLAVATGNIDLDPFEDVLYVRP